MNRTKYAANGSKRSMALVSLGLILLLAQAVGHAQVLDALPFSRGYLITGGYVVGGVDLAPASGGGGFLTGTIHMSASNVVPPNAEILGAFVYWEAITTDVSQTAGARFRGSLLTNVKASSRPLTPATAQCWSSGGGGGALYTMTMFSADVLHLLPIQPDVNGNPAGRRVVNDSDLAKYGFPLHTVTLPEAGSGNQVPQSAGASLFVIYRDATKPLTSISVYEGIHIQEPGATMKQTIRGFLQSSTSQDARMTQIVGSGAKNPTDRVWFDNGRTALTLLATDAFAGTNNASSDRSWANPTFVVPSNSTATSLMPGKDFNDGYGETVTTTVVHQNTSPYDCLSWAAIIFSTAVPDRDGDGNPDQLEDNSTDVAGNHWKDPNDQVLPDLHAMGASSDHKDFFAEIGYMTTTGYTDGQGVVPAHSHRPSKAALRMVGDAFWNAPVMNLDGTTGIRIHFDAGNAYPIYSGVDDAYAERYIIRNTTTPGLARGGETIKEDVCHADTHNPPRWNCQFPDYHGTVTWKRGFLAHRDAWVKDDGEQFDRTLAGDAATLATCQASGNCRRRFDRARINLFHYALFAHSRGIPVSSDPMSPDFHVPRSSAGRGDLPVGGDVLVSLGWWDNFVGTDLNQASALAHEFGHNLGLWHGGSPLQITDVGAAPHMRVQLYVQPNCKSNYLSSMNYVFGYTGLLDDYGVPHVDYSSGVINDLDESVLSDGPLTSTTPGYTFQYRTAWFAPWVSGGPSPARVFCDGASFPNPLPTTWIDMVRVDAQTATESIDWNRNGPAPTLPQDINFSGDLDGAFASPPTPPLRGLNDWASVLLNQVGSRGNVAGLSSLGGDLDAFGGDLDAFGGDLDAFGGDLDAFGGDLDAFGGDLDAFGGDLDAFGGDLDAFGGGEEPTYAAAVAAGCASPNTLRACVLGVDCQGASSPLHKTSVEWNLPAICSDKVSFYSGYRVQGDTFVPSSAVPVGTPSATTSLLDNTELPHGVKFAYSATATFSDATVSDYSVSRNGTITAVNDAPAATADNYDVNQGASLEVTASCQVAWPAGAPLRLVGKGVLCNDTDTDSASLTAVIDTPPSHAATFSLNADGSFSYTPNAGFGGTDSFTYKAKDVTPISARNVSATVTITVHDNTPPVVNLSIPAPTGSGGYFNSKPVAVGVTATDASGVASFTCTDNGTPIVPGSLTGIGSSPAGGTLSVTGEGTHNLSCVATDGASPSNTGAAAGSLNTGIVKIDTVQPVAAITSGPSEGAEITTASASFGFSATDPAPGSGVASTECRLDGGAFSSCASPKNVSNLAIGPHTFSVRATDVAGNVGSGNNVATRNFKVVYTFTLSPLKSPANLGSAVPINWQLKDPQGNAVNSLSTLLKLESVFNGPVPPGGCVSSANGTRVLLYSPATGATGGSNFRLVSGGYQFNWDTSTATPTGKGCYTVLISLSDLSNAKLTNAVQLK